MASNRCAVILCPAFPPDLPPGHGMFYSGWRNHLNAGIALLSEDERELVQLRFLIAGVSASATVVGMGVTQINGDHEVSRAMSQFGEANGFPLGIDKRRYLGGVLPVGDAFEVHATTARPWRHKKSAFTVQSKHVSKYWRGGIHLLSILAGVVLVFVWRQSGFVRRQSDKMIGHLGNA